MSRASDETRRARIAELIEKIDEEIETLQTRLDETSEHGYRYFQEAKKYHSAGDKDRAIHYLRLKKGFDNIGNTLVNRIAILTDASTKLETTTHKLFIRSLPAEITAGIQNLDPSVVVNNNSLERRMSRKYGLPNYNAPPPPAENNSNVVESRGCLRDAFGRCIEGIRARLTRKNNKNKNKKEGGRRKKGKSMKRRN